MCLKISAWTSGDGRLAPIETGTTSVVPYLTVRHRCVAWWLPSTRDGRRLLTTYFKVEAVASGPKLHHTLHLYVPRNTTLITT